MFPEEILHAIVLALLSKPMFSETLLELHWRYARTKLLSLSLVSSQLRRICTPFLFAYIEVRGAYGDLSKLRNQCVANQSFAACIRTFDLYCYAPEQVDAIQQILHLCTNISQVILNKVHLDKALLGTLRRHPVPTIALATYPLPRDSTEWLYQLDLSNISVDHTKINDVQSEIELAKHLDCDIQIRCLTIQHKNLHKSFETYRFRGLRELELWPGQLPFTLSWLPDFTAAHPLLRKIRVLTPSIWDIYREFPPIWPFLEAAEAEGLINDMKLQLKAFSVTRAKPGEPSCTAPFSGWQVTGLWLSIAERFSDRLFQLAHSAFPQLHIISLENPLPARGNQFINTEELITSLCRFSSLQTVNFIHIFDNLDYCSQQSLGNSHAVSIMNRYPGSLMIRRKSATGNIERALEIVARITQRIRTVERVLMQEISFRGFVYAEGDGTTGMLRPLTDSEVNNLFSLYV